jgi:outer membrane lipoprotein SlyB
MRGFLAAGVLMWGLAGCGPSYSPDTYASNAVQQANPVQQGTVVGVRNVAVSAAGTVGTVTGAAVGGIAGSQAAASPISAFTALGGSLVGGIAGSAVEHSTADTTAFEYIVRKANGDLVSVTQKDKTPLALGQKVLVIAGSQARVVPDYTVPPPLGGPPLGSPIPMAATAGMPSKPDAAPAAPADTKPAEPVRADTAPANPAPAASETSPAAGATTPVTAPAAPAAVPEASPGGHAP